MALGGAILKGVESRISARHENASFSTTLERLAPVELAFDFRSVCRERALGSGLSLSTLQLLVRLHGFMESSIQLMLEPDLSYVQRGLELGNIARFRVSVHEGSLATQFPWKTLASGEFILDNLEYAMGGRDFRSRGQKSVTRRPTAPKAPSRTAVSRRFPSIRLWEWGFGTAVRS